MTLLTAVFAAIIATLAWYKTAPKNELKLNVLSLMYWGASLMWFVDAIFEFVELKSEYFSPEPLEMLNDLFLGLSAVALGLVIWIIYLLIKDPKGVVREALLKKE